MLCYRKVLQSTGGRGRNRRGGWTMIEVLIGSVIGVLVAAGVMSMTIAVSRMSRATFYEQMSIKHALAGIEGINREVRLATTSLSVVDANGVPALQGNRFLFNRKDEPSLGRSIAIVSKDSNLLTAYDNTLVYDPDVTKSGDEQVWAKWMTPIKSAGAFTYKGGTEPLVVEMRVGDPMQEVSGKQTPMEAAKNNAYSGPGVQGMEINVSVAPRN